jgi:bacteriocin biosynthesis cyclodehydratase domain-containing protein
MSGIRLKDIDIIEMSGNILQVRFFGRVYLFELESDTYKAELFRLFKLLDGQRSADELATLVELPAGEVRTILGTLQGMSLTETVEAAPIADAPPPEYLEQHAAVFRMFASSKARSAAECERRVHAQCITVLGDDPLADELARRLPEFGFGSEPPRLRRLAVDSWPTRGGSGPELVVLPLGQYDHRGVLDAVNRRAVDAGDTLVPIYCDDGVVNIGPTVVPRKTACLQCLDLRVTSNVDNQEALASYRAHVAAQGRRYPDLPAHLTALSVFVCHELLRITTGYQQAVSYNGILKLDLWSSELRRCSVLRFPSCPVCSARARRPRYDDHAFATMLAQI